MKPEDQVLWFIRIWVLAAVAFYAVAWFPTQLTISSMMQQWMRDNPIIAVVAGGVLVHWSWPVPQK